VRVHCKSCGGRYDDVSADGVPYAHACPDVSGKIVMRAGDRVDIGNAHPEPTDTVVKEYTRPPANKRDERVIQHFDGPDTIVSAGDGVIKADDDAALDEILEFQRDMLAIRDATHDAGDGGEGDDQAHGG
jgi:hypothetical protein